MLSTLILFAVLFLTLSLQFYLQYRHRLASFKYEMHIRSQLDAMRIGDDELDYKLQLHKAMRFNNKW